MLLSVASKGAVSEWVRNKVRHRTVVYLAGEGHHGLRGRVAAWKQHKAVSGLDMWLSRHGLDLNTPQGYQKTADACKKHGKALGVGGIKDGPMLTDVINMGARFLMGRVDGVLLQQAASKEVTELRQLVD